MKVDGYIDRERRNEDEEGKRCLGVWVWGKELCDWLGLL